MSIADKLQGLIDGKQYVVDKVNQKTGSNFTIDSKWKDIGDTVGSYEGASGGSDYLALRVSGTPYEYSNSDITSLVRAAFYYDNVITKASFENVISVGYDSFCMCNNIQEINLPKATTGDNYCFKNCYKLENINIPNLKKVPYGAFSYNYKLKRINLPKATGVGTSAFEGCRELESINFQSDIYSFDGNAFYNCYSLKAVIVGSKTMVNIWSTNVFTNCYHILGTVNETYNPNGDKDGYIYVPDTLVDSYKSATNWSAHADQIKPLSELPQEYKTLYGIE